METENSELLLEKITRIFVGTHNFQELAKSVVDVIGKELQSQYLVGVGIFRVHERDNVLYAYAYWTRFNQIIDRLLPKKFAELNVWLTLKENLLVKTVTSGQIAQSLKLADFSRGAMPDAVADRVQKIVKGRLCVAFPIFTKHGKVAGVMLVMIKEEKVTGPQLVLFETLANQLGLAFTNVFEFEKLIEKYKNIISRELNTNVNKEDIPTVKFTLRISPNENKKLENLAKEKGKTKAEVLRDFLDQV